jgi:MFS family permease
VAPAVSSSNYKWIVLSNTTIGMLLATINASILLIALPDIFRGIHINPLAPANTNYLLWMILSFLVVTAVLVVSLGRIGDMYAAIAGTFLGLIIGGVLAPVDWRLVFLVSVPFGLFGTVWAYLKLVDLSERRPARIDWLGNVTFAEIIGGIFVLAVFCVIETRVEQPMFHLDLFRIRAFAAGNLATLLSAIGRGGLQFTLIIWLQGIWLPQHGYSFSQTPLWAGIYMLPLTAGFLIAGPASGFLSDRYGARPFATGGMVIAAISFILLEQLPVNFSYVWFALLLLLNGIGMGLFASPNRAGVMNSLPPRQRGAGAGMNATFQNSAMVLSIGIFFSLLIVGLAAHLPSSLDSGLTAHGVPAADATRISHLPPVATLFAAFLGYNPIQQLLGPALLGSLPHAQVAALTGRSFFPHLMSAPFSGALGAAFTFSFVACLVAAWASWLRGGKYHYREEEAPTVTVTDGSADSGSSPRAETDGAPDRPGAVVQQ